MGGILPDYLGNLSTTLVELDLGTNQIYGSIPLGLFNLVGLRRINLQGNLLTGHLSPQIGKLAKLEIFSCIGNRLIGSIPDSIGNLSRLSSLWLGENNFNGMIPSSLGQCTNLLDLYLSQNNLTGLVPPQLFLSSSTLIYFYLDSNQLQGELPEEIGQIKNLIQFVIHKNAFSGELPSSLGSCTAIDVIDVGANFFTGSIPDSFKSLTSLSYLNVVHNNLSGQIPNFLSKFPLMTIDLSFNSFQGEVPTKGAFANLSALNISGNNQLCGGVPNLHYFPRCLPKSTSDNRGSKYKVFVEIVTISIASLVLSVSILSLVYFLLCSRRKQNKLSYGSGMSLTEPFSKVSYDMLLKATDSFSEANLLSAGHFGSVYKTVLDLESNMVVAIKVIRLVQRGASKSFMAECEALRSLRHRNLLKIVTVCSSTDFQGNDFKALVYEYMTNGSFHHWIHTDPNLRTLSLLQRVEIAIDVARALDYLHNDCDEPIIHCDLKPSNILLDDDMVAHVGDFGLARFHLRARANDSSSVAVKGTVGYAAPGKNKIIWVNTILICSIFLSFYFYFFNKCIYLFSTLIISSVF
ncbi:receptor kinase-like protein Xa21 [Chenopodium quinoa]|uniref:receptor kinase-like protein Xa21 n=1 Tax=Chenopodium quinoa TaxID=63459 RepID=UPI000B78F8F5|nr:receptor kinase-like protein Xa21 [Chenopodium quinoa]